MQCQTWKVSLRFKGVLGIIYPNPHFIGGISKVLSVQMTSKWPAQTVAKPGSAIPFWVGLLPGIYLRSALFLLEKPMSALSSFLLVNLRLSLQIFKCQKREKEKGKKRASPRRSSRALSVPVPSQCLGHSGGCVLPDCWKIWGNNIVCMLQKCSLPFSSPSALETKWHAFLYSYLYIWMVVLGCMEFIFSWSCKYLFQVHRYCSYLLRKACSRNQTSEKGREPSLKAFNPENSDFHVRIKTTSSSDPKVPNFRWEGFTPETIKRWF